MSDLSLTNTDPLDAAQEAHDEVIDTPIVSVEQKVAELDQTSTGVAKKEAGALPIAAEPNAQVTPGTHSAIVNPATGLSHNPFTWFHLHVLSKLETYLPFVAEVAGKTAYVVSENQNSPTFAAAQAKLISAAVALSAAASVAVAEKGLNPTQDAATISLLTNLVAAVHTYVGILETEYQDAKTTNEAPASN